MVVANGGFSCEKCDLHRPCAHEKKIMGTWSLQTEVFHAKSAVCSDHVPMKTKLTRIIHKVQISSQLFLKILTCNNGVNFF
jgi:hypothetical protein